MQEHGSLQRKHNSRNKSSRGIERQSSPGSLCVGSAKWHVDIITCSQCGATPGINDNVDVVVYSFLWELRKQPAKYLCCLQSQNTELQIQKRSWIKATTNRQEAYESKLLPRNGKLVCNLTLEQAIRFLHFKQLTMKVAFTKRLVLGAKGARVVT